MPWVDLGNGGTAHICIRGGRSPRCEFCNTGYSEKLCDFPINARGKTCDAKMCARCSSSISPEADFCPRHKHQTPPQQKLGLFPAEGAS